MKFVIAISCLLAVTLADRDAQILHDDRSDQGDGNFHFSFSSDNGIEKEVIGTPGSEGQSNMQGFYLLPLDGGGFARVNFVANEAGFQPESDILPTPHPFPAHVHELIAIAQEQREQGITFKRRK